MVTLVLFNVNVSFEHAFSITGVAIAPDGLVNLTSMESDMFMPLPALLLKAVATPVIEKACSNETFTLNNTNVTIATRFDLDTLLNSITTIAHKPDGSNEPLLQIRNFTDLNGSNNYTSYFNYSLKPNVSGIYNFTVRVMDIENNSVNVTSTITVSTGTKTFNISGIGISDIKLLDSCSGDIIQSGSA